MGSGASKDGTYKLSYFNGRGRAETARLCFAAAGVKFTDNRIEQSDWPKYKPKTPLGSVPVLEFNGKELTQSLVINRFLAERFGLMGSKSLEKAKIDEVMTTICDFAVDCVSVNFASDKAAAIKNVLENKAPTVLKYLKKTAECNPSKSGYLIGTKLSLADLAAYNAFEQFQALSDSALNGYEILKTCRDKVAANPNIAKYLKDRAVTPF